MSRASIPKMGKGERGERDERGERGEDAKNPNVHHLSP